MELPTTFFGWIEFIWEEYAPLFLKGTVNTLILAIAGTVIGFALGLLVAVLRTIPISKKDHLLKKIVARIVNCIISIYIEVFRGTPMIVQAFIVYFGVPQLIQLMLTAMQITDTVRISPFLAGVITLSLNAGAYLSEIFRSGINAVSRGQVEAARSLGLSHWRTMTKIVLPQAFKITLPSLVNQFIITIKDTSILSVIGLADIVNRAKVYVGKSYQFFATYILVAVYYLVVISILMLVSKYLEKKVNYEHKS